MPIYEYRCADCKRRTSAFVRSVTSPARPACEHCGGRNLTRLMSKFAVHRAGAASADDGLDDLAGVDEDDPRSVARWARKMRDEMGDDLGPEFDHMIDRMESGESPDDIMAGAGMDDEGDDDF
ncbi:MAG: zinc ribbon domain-containing protein [Dehalococcoidia bacterium]